MDLSLVLVINNLEIEPSFIFPSNAYFAIVVFPQPVTAIATASTGGTSLLLSTSSGVLVQVLTIVGAGVIVRHDNISFVLYKSMC